MGDDTDARSIPRQISKITALYQPLRSDIIGIRQVVSGVINSNYASTILPAHLAHSSGNRLAVRKCRPVQPRLCY